MSTALARLVVKKLAEMAARPKSDDKNKDTKEAIALAYPGLQLRYGKKLNTRNWQSLPHTIYYTRIPCSREPITSSSAPTVQASETINLVVNGRSGQQVQNIVTLK